MKKIGIFGGSFNPIHIGHLALGNFLCETGAVDELWFMVSPQNPLKRHEELLDDNIRLELVQKAVKDYPKFKASDFEFTLPRPSYMVHTLDALKKKYPTDKFVLIIGGDNWKSFTQWYESERIIADNEMLVYPRPHIDIDENTLPENVKLANAPLMEISSTFIREGIRKGLDFRFFLPEIVYQIINEKKLYR